MTSPPPEVLAQLQLTFGSSAKPSAMATPHEPKRATSFSASRTHAPRRRSTTWMRLSMRLPHQSPKAGWATSMASASKRSSLGEFLSVFARAYSCDAQKAPTRVAGKDAALSPDKANFRKAQDLVRGWVLSRRLGRDSSARKLLVSTSRKDQTAVSLLRHALLIYSFAQIRVKVSRITLAAEGLPPVLLAVCDIPVVCAGNADRGRKARTNPRRD